jgi:hypothetical protein
MEVTTIVERLYNDFEEIKLFLTENGQPSFSSTADNTFKKNILLASASYFEAKVCIFIEEHAKINSNDLISNLVLKKAISRQYHTYFNWDGKNANQFFALFGPDFKDFMVTKIKDDLELAKSISDFIELGRERNRLVHQNFASYNIEKTATEIYQTYISAKKFIDALPDCFDEYLKGKSDSQ